MAGVDLVKIRRAHPGLLMIGGFDKITLRKGVKAMRLEFERPLPAIKSAGHLLTVDHQTPPECSLAGA